MNVGSKQRKLGAKRVFDVLVTVLTAPVWGVLLAVVAFALAGRTVAAQHTATQTVQLAVQPVMRISVSGSPGALVIDDVAPGASVSSVTDRSTRYGLVTNRNARNPASIAAPLPEGTQLHVGLDSGLGESAGMVDLSEATQAVTLVSGLRSGRDVDRRITYTFSADLDESGFFEGEARTVVFTILE